MSNLNDHLHTDWAALTANDWIGMGITVAVFLLMCGLYFYVLRPKNRARLESYRDMALRDDDLVSGEKR